MCGFQIYKVVPKADYGNMDRIKKGEAIGETNPPISTIPNDTPKRKKVGVQRCRFKPTFLFLSSRNRTNLETFFGRFGKVGGVGVGNSIELNLCQAFFQQSLPENKPFVVIGIVVYDA